MSPKFRVAWECPALLFVFGVMNLLWIAVLSLFVLLEKFANRGNWISYLSGSALLLWAGLVAARTALVAS